MRASVSITDVAAANAAADASHVFAGTDAADMGAGAKTSITKTSAAETSAAKASDMSSANRTAAAHVAAVAKTFDVTATTAAASVGCAREQARSEKRCRQYRDRPFHRDTPSSSGCSAP